MFLFIVINGKIDLNDIEIEFIQRENNQTTWSSKVKPDVIYNNSVIIFQTPSYDKQVVEESKVKVKPSSTEMNKVDKTKISEHPVKVFYRLLRPSTKEFSPEWTFYYSKSKYTILDDLSISFINKLNDVLSEKIIYKTETNKMEATTEDEEVDDEDDDSDLDETDQIPKKPADDASLETVRNLVDDRRKKMNLLVDRTCAALLDVAQSRSIHKLIKIQRYLLNIQNVDGNTPVHLAVLNGHFDLVEIFIDIALTIPHYNIINVKNNLQLTPLLLAAHMEEHELCNFLLESTANLSDIDLAGQNCFHIAAKKGNLMLTKVLINFVKANLDKAYLMNLLNYEGDTPLHIACKLNAYEIVEEYLFSDLCRINEQNKRTGETPLHYSCSRNYIQLTKLLVKHLQKRTLDIDVQSYNGCTALHMAIANRNYLITRLLIKSNANTFVQSIESIHGNFICSIKNEEFFIDFNKKFVFKQKNVMLTGKTNVLEKSLGDVKKRAEILVDSNIDSDKFAVEITDVNIGDESVTASKKYGLDVYFEHCCDAFNYALNDKIMLKLIGTFKNDLYLPRDEINAIMDCELRKKLVYKMNLSQLKITSSLESSQVDFIRAIENQMKALNEDFKLKMRLVNNENEQLGIKRRTNNESEMSLKKVDFKRTRVKENE